MTYRYQCYGVALASDYPISSLEEVATLTQTSEDYRVLWKNPPFINIAWQALTAGKSTDRKRVTISKGTHNRRTVYRFHRNTVALGQIYTYFSPEHRQIWHVVDDAIAITDHHSAFVGAVLGSLLSFSGTLCLHASAVEHDGEAILFIGRSGSGKSTTALFATDHWQSKMITDDIGAINQGAGLISVAPGYRKLRLDETKIDQFVSVRHQIGDPVYSNQAKSYVAVDACPQKTKIKAIVSLNRSSDLQKPIVTQQFGAAAFFDCSCHIYAREAWVQPNAARAQSESVKKVLDHCPYFIADMPDAHEYITPMLDELIRQVG